MQAAENERIDTVERKIDDGFAGMRREFKTVRAEMLSTERELRREIISSRSEARADFRTLVALVSALWATTAFAVVGMLTHHL